jgi:hypothetical protein
MRVGQKVVKFGMTQLGVGTIKGFRDGGKALVQFDKPYRFTGQQPTLDIVDVRHLRYAK